MSYDITCAPTLDAGVIECTTLYYSMRIRGVGSRNVAEHRSLQMNDIGHIACATLFDCNRRTRTLSASSLVSIGASLSGMPYFSSLLRFSILYDVYRRNGIGSNEDDTDMRRSKLTVNINPQTAARNSRAQDTAKPLLENT